MRKMLLTTAAAAGLLATPLVAQAGCLTGAAVGGVAGHMVHHGVIGAAAGCAVGHHHSVMQRRANDAGSTTNAAPAGPTENH